MMSKNLLKGVAISGMLLGGCTTPSGGGDNAVPTKNAAVGECHGINSCKGKGDCGGKGYSCAGKNACKGKGWIKMNKADCEKKGGTFTG
jgi:hypothetical protein